MTSKTKARLLASGNNSNTPSSSSNSTNNLNASNSSHSSSSSSRSRRRRHARDEPQQHASTSSSTPMLSSSSSSSSSRRGRSGRSGGGNKGGHEHFDDDADDVNGGGGAGAVRYEDEEPVFQSQLYALEEFERAFVSERAALGLAPVNSNGGDSASSSRSHRRRHRDNQSSVSSSPPRRRRSSQSVLLTTAGVPLLDALLENIVVMKSGRWDCLELISAPAFGEVVRVEDQGILLIAPTRTHMHIPSRPSDAKLCVLNHLLETLQYPHTAEFDETKSTIVLVNADNGVRADLRTPVIVPTPLYLRSERATRGIIIAMPGEIVVSPSGRLSPKSNAAATGAAAAAVTESSEPAAPAAAAAAATGDDAMAKRKNKLSRVQWRLSRNIATEFRSDQEH